jgi:hypothetical protein
LQPAVIVRNRNSTCAAHPIHSLLSLADMTIAEQIVPPGPAEKYDPADNVPEI